MFNIKLWKIHNLHNILESLQSKIFFSVIYCTYVIRNHMSCYFKFIFLALTSTQHIFTAYWCFSLFKIPLNCQPVFGINNSNSILSIHNIIIQDIVVDTFLPISVFKKYSPYITNLKQHKILYY